MFLSNLLFVSQQGDKLQETIIIRERSHSEDGPVESALRFGSHNNKSEFVSPWEGTKPIIPGAEAEKHPHQVIYEISFEDFGRNQAGDAYLSSPRE